MVTSVPVSPVVVVLTALDLEYQAVRGHLVGLEEVRHPHGTLYEVGRLPGTAGSVAIALTTMGNNAAAALAERAISLFDPIAVLFIGIAGALHEHLNPGDVVVATRVYAIHGARVEDDASLARPRSWEAPHGLDQRARSIGRSGAWTRRLAAPPVSTPNVWFGPIAAGEVVLNSRDSWMYRWLRDHFNDAVAIEMEGAGAALAGHLSGPVPVLVVRGISDRADGRKDQADRDGLQPVAAAHAAAFGLAVASAVLDGAQVTAPGQAGPGPAGPAPHSQTQHVVGHGGTVFAVLSGNIHLYGRHHPDDDEHRR